MDTVAMYAFIVLFAQLYLVTSQLSEQPASINSVLNTSIYNLTNEQVYVYKYSAVVSTGQNEPIPYVSKFKIKGKFFQKSDSSDPNLRFTKYMKFHDIKYALYNGAQDDEVHDGEFQILNDTVKDFEEPILIVTDQFNKLQGIKIQDKESVWSKNMKKSLASIMQVEFKGFDLHENMKETAFQKIEVGNDGWEHTDCKLNVLFGCYHQKTIHGDCDVNYNIYTMDNGRGKIRYYVRKVFEPKSCSKYVQYADYNESSMDDRAKLEESLITSVERLYEFEYVSKDFLMKKLITNEILTYLPSSHKNSILQFIKTNQTFEFETITDSSTLNLPIIDFKQIKLNSDITFENFENITTAEDNFGRHEKKLNDSIAEVKKLLVCLMDYLEENHIKMKDMYENRESLLIKLRETMTRLDSESMYYIYKNFDTKFEKGHMIRNIFLEMIPYTGTYAAWNFTKYIINNHEVSDEMAVNMLTNLPFHVFYPKEEFTKEMVGFEQFDKDIVSQRIKEAGILCYSILLHKTYKNIKKDVPVFLKKQLYYFNERIKLETTYRLKVLYMMAMRNVEVGNIYQYLSPIVRGDDVPILSIDTVKPEKYRVAAMWAVAKSISHDKELIYNLFWPIFSNGTQTLSMRITAYEFLVPRNPTLDVNLLMNIHWAMLKEDNPHMLNYHYTTLKSVAHSTNEYTKSTSEVIKKILRIIQQRKFLSATLSQANIFYYFNTKNDYGKIFKIGMIFNEVSLIPQIGYCEEISIFGERAMLNKGVYWNLDGINLNSTTTLFKTFIKQQTLNEIPNENIKNLLRQTHGHKLLEKEIKVELWIMDKNYVTLLYEINLSEFFSKYVKNYMPSNFMDDEENFNYNFLDISFFNHYKMIVTTDIGIPALLHNVVPQISYIKLNPNIYIFKTIITTRVNFEFKFYRLNSYKMKFYNSFADVTHSIQKGITADVSLPFDVTINLNLDTYSVKIILSRMPETKFSIAGIKAYSIDQVEIENDRANMLKVFCPDCENVANIRKNVTNNKIYDFSINSIDTGLEYRYTIFDCEGITLRGIENEELFTIFDAIKNNANDDSWQIYKMMIDQRLFNFMTALYTNNCGLILKVSPCKNYSISHIEMFWRFNVHKFGSDLQLNIRGSIGTKTTSTNETLRSWNIHVNIDFSQFLKDLKLQLTRKTKGEENLMICLDFQKVYPNYITNSKEIDHATDTKLTFAMNYSENTTCIHDSLFINMTIKGELVDEQLEQIKRNVKPGSCFRNPSNPLDLDITQRFDWNCLYQAIKFTTMKKYSINMSYKKLPYEVLTKFMILDESLRLHNLPRVVYKPNRTEHGNIKILITYSTDNSYGNITVINPFLSYELTKVPYASIAEEDRPIDLTLDNTGFSTTFLIDYYYGKIRPCIVHTNDIITNLNKTITMEFKNWTLVMGDYELMTYAVFIKATPNNKLAMKIYINTCILEIHPGESKPMVALNGTIIQNYEKGILTSTSLHSESYLKLMMINQLLMIEINGSSDVKIYYTPYNVVIFPQINFFYNVDGVCGHLGSLTYDQPVPLICNDC